MHKYKTTFKDFSISCPRCFSRFFWRYGKNKHGHQKYICRNCYHQFTLESNKST